MNYKPLIKPILNNLPFLYGTFGLGTGGTDNARYCYSVWLRHLVKAQENGMHGVPKIVAELGPGDSLGVGLAALLSGAEKYYALDAVKYAKAERNKIIYEELKKLFGDKAAIPGDEEFPLVNPKLGDYGWPDLTLSLSFARRGDQSSRAGIIDDGGLLKQASQFVPSPLACPEPGRREGEGQASPEPRRRDEVNGRRTSPQPSPSLGGGVIKYVAPWDDPQSIMPNTVDLIIAQAVLEHVDDLVRTYETLYLWLKPGGFLSQDIDFKSHNFTWKWNGHWGIGDGFWEVLKGRRKWVINREPLSKHLEILQDTGFEVVVLDKTKRTDGIRREKLAPRFAHMPEEDFETSQAYVLARKPVK